jgi:hypothetical protein
MNIEQTLRTMRERAALLRYMCDVAAVVDAPAPPRAALSGMGDVCEDIERMAQQVADALDLAALDATLGTRRRR